MDDSGNKSSGVAGVIWEKDRQIWRVLIPIGGKQRHIGRYKDLETAIAKRLNAEQGVFPTVEEKRTVILDKMSRLRLRLVWREVLKLGPTTWTSFDHFLSTVGERPKKERFITAKDINFPVGPGNFVWTAPEFDHSSSEGRKAYYKQHRKDNPMLYRDKAFRKTFGITLEDYQRMFVEQGGACATCKRPETAKRNGTTRWLTVDHNHTTGVIRGLLCTQCNVAIGMLREDREIILALVEYLDRYKNSEEALPDNVVRMK